ncbi:hypothetical protein C7377_1804 [Balneicella halophila]|uniref:DNA primase n=1 Tax=Balneicella halophila TaxID=1537566 RepID=A0A7L4UN67_BALHA|nr:hypothetical protein [Balneicella halophila]PVX49388.1 hypothetical protein C7377_1804 [Balneicella halophila]
MKKETKATPLQRKIVDYKKLTDEILSLLVEKYPEGYEDKDIIAFKNSLGETIEAVEVCTDDTKYLVKVSKRLASSMQDYEDSLEDDISVSDEFDEVDEDF